MGTNQIYDPATWSRAGRGRELQFFATDDEVQHWISQLPGEYGPYSIWGTHLEKHEHGYERTLFLHPLTERARALVTPSMDGSSPPEQFFVHAAAIMPELPTHRDAARSANEWGTLNGLVLVQHGSTRAGRRLVSRIAVADKLKNRESGKVVSLKDRNVVFDALRAMIEGRLCFTTIQVFKDGHEEEDGSLLMTLKAAKLARRGYFVRKAGRRLDG
jgi:hypothetical protein